MLRNFMAFNNERNKKRNRNQFKGSLTCTSFCAQQPCLEPQFLTENFFGFWNVCRFFLLVMFTNKLSERSLVSKATLSHAKRHFRCGFPCKNIPSSFCLNLGSLYTLSFVELSTLKSHYPRLFTSRYLKRICFFFDRPVINYKITKY